MSAIDSAMGIDIQTLKAEYLYDCSILNLFKLIENQIIRNVFLI